jgi:hypothetical protein
MRWMQHETGVMRTLVRNVALGAFLFYLVWNAVWVGEGKVPPSILKALSGYPCPTTGGFRSFLALSRGDLAQSFFFNPLTMVYLLLLAWSLAVLARQLFRGHRLVLSPVLAWAWLLSLTIGWVAKFALGRQYW